MYRYKGRSFETTRQLSAHLGYITETMLLTLYSDRSYSQYELESIIDEQVARRKAVIDALDLFNTKYKYNFRTVTKATNFLFRERGIKRAMKTNSAMKDYQVLQLYCLVEGTPLDWLIFNKTFEYKGNSVSLKEFCALHQVRARTLYLDILSKNGVNRFTEKYLSEQDAPSQ